MLNQIKGDKKKVERKIIEKFVSNSDLKLPVKSIKDSETPDFKVETFTNKLSIELTSLINPSLKEKENFRNKILIGAEKLFNEKYRENLYVLVTFSSSQINCKRKEITKYSEEVFAFVEKLYVPLRGFEFDISSDNVELPFYIEKITIHNIFDFSNWQTFGAFLVPHFDKEILRRAIEVKEKNIIKYGEKFDENWLVLVSNFGTKSSAGRFDILNYTDIVTLFDRVFVYKYFEDKILFIK